MVFWRALSLPLRTTVLALAAVVIILAVWWGAYKVYGEVTITSNAANATVETAYDDIVYTAPHTYRLKPGKRQFHVSAPGYVAQTVTHKVYAFRRVTYDITLQKATYTYADPKKVPLYSDLPYQTANFAIDPPTSDGTYRIVLYATLNRLDQYDDYQSALNQYGQEALQWIRSKGIDPTTIKLAWDPRRPSKIPIGVDYAP